MQWGYCLCVTVSYCSGYIADVSQLATALGILLMCQLATLVGILLMCHSLATVVGILLMYHS